MTGKPENPPAFACAAENGHQEGMSLRDYFAIHAPEATHEITWGHIKAFKKLPMDARIEEWRSEWTTEYRAMLRYRYADAMLTERTKPNG